MLNLPRDRQELLTIWQAFAGYFMHDHVVFILHTTIRRAGSLGTRSMRTKHLTKRDLSSIDVAAVWYARTRKDHEGDFMLNE